MTEHPDQRPASEHLHAWLASAAGFVVYRLRLSDDAGSTTDAVVDLVSPSLWDVMGVPVDALFERWFANIHPDDRARVEEQSGAAAATGTRFESTMRIWHPVQREWRHIRAVSTPVTDSDGRSFNGLIIDVTAEQRALERESEARARLEALERLETVGRLAGGVAHDFNNLLMVIQAATETIADLSLPEGADAPLDDIQRQVRLGRDLTDLLLGYARRGSHQPALIEMSELIRRVIDVLARTRHDVRLESDLPTEAWVRADPSQIERVCMNILVNAFEAMPSAGTVTVRLGRAGNRHQLRIVDEGAGIDEVTQRRVFEPFFTTKLGVRDRHGLGLGLAATWGIVESLGGDIELESEPGRGTTVTVRLPVAESPLPETQIVVDDRAPVARPMRILVVDDQPAVLAALVAVVTSLGHTCVAAGSGREALDVLEVESKFDVAIVDARMPGIGGLDLISEMRHVAPAVGVVLTSGVADERLRREAAELGVTTLLGKPFDRNRLASTLEALLP